MGSNRIEYNTAGILICYVQVFPIISVADPEFPRWGRVGELGANPYYLA